MVKIFQFSAVIKVVTLVALLTATDDAKGQSSSRQSCVIQASATITGTVPLTLETLQHIRLSGNTEKEGIIYISPVSSAQAGLMRITANPGAQLLLHYQTTENVISEDGNGYLSVRYELSGYYERLQQVSEPYYSGEAVFTTGGNGHYYLWVGGTFYTGEAVSGRFSGRFTIEIEYI